MSYDLFQYLRRCFRYLPGLSKEKSSWVAGQWKANLPAFSRISAGQTLNVNQLVDMEWKFGGEMTFQYLKSYLILIAAL